MSGVVCNATPLIYLAKANRIDLLERVFGIVFIPQEAKAEVVDEGKRLGEKDDAYIVEKAINKGWLKVIAVETIDVPIKLDKGETAVLSLANKLKLKVVLVDEI